MEDTLLLPAFGNSLPNAPDGGRQVRLQNVLHVQSSVDRNRCICLLQLGIKLTLVTLVEVFCLVEVSGFKPKTLHSLREPSNLSSQPRYSQCAARSEPLHAGLRRYTET